MHLQISGNSRDKTRGEMNLIQQKDNKKILPLEIKIDYCYKCLETASFNQPITVLKSKNKELLLLKFQVPA